MGLLAQGQLRSSGMSLCNIYVCVHTHSAWEMLTLVRPPADPQTAQAQTWLEANAIKVGVSVPEDSVNPEKPPMHFRVPPGCLSGCLLRPATLSKYRYNR